MKIKYFIHILVLFFTTNTLAQQTNLEKAIDAVDTYKSYLFVCGDRLQGLEKKEYISKIVSEVFIRSAKLDIDPWGILGIIENESGFDYCAIGPKPRNYGIKLKIIKPKKQTISYKKEKVLKIINNKKVKKFFAGSGIDIGLCQVLTRYYRQKPETLFSVEASLDRCFMHAKNQKSKTPWLYWPGHKSPKYAKKIKWIINKIKKYHD